MIINVEPQQIGEMTAVQSLNGVLESLVAALCFVSCCLVSRQRIIDIRAPVLFLKHLQNERLVFGIPRNSFDKLVANPEFALLGDPVRLVGRKMAAISPVLRLSCINCLREFKPGYRDR